MPLLRYAEAFNAPTRAPRQPMNIMGGRMMRSQAIALLIFRYSSIITLYLWLSQKYWIFREKISYKKGIYSI